MKTHLNRLRCITLAALLLTPLESLHAVEVANLRCEYLKDPLGIDVAKPRLSWTLAAPQSEISNLKSEIKRSVGQTAYQVLVASSEELLKKDNGDLWDSGKVESDRSIQVEYAGKPMVSRQQCFWKVRVWTAKAEDRGQRAEVRKKEECSAWSIPSRWTMGLLKPEDWTARWITHPGWGYLIKELGLNTWPETWSGWGSHVILVTATPGSWFYEGLAGIRPDPVNPGFKHFTLRPGIVSSVDWVKCAYQSPYGKIVSNWKREGQKLAMDVTVPPNTTATVYVPAKEESGVTESDTPAAQANGVKFLRMENGAAVYAVGSGVYRFQSTTREGTK